MSQQIRTFIAIELDDETRRTLAHIQDRMKAGRAGRYVRWVAPEGIHLTLKFLGDVEADEIAALEQAVAAACAGISPFPLRLEALGAFPNLKRPRVVWVGLAGEVEAAERLAARIEDACARLGYPREERAYSPHLTLGRVKREARPGDAQLVGEMVAQATIGHVAEFRVQGVSVMKSDLRPTGSVYARLHRVELMGV